MEPVLFEGANVLFTAENCKDLPALKTEGEIISCWKFTPEEVKALMETGELWFSIIGDIQPPIWMGVDRPFTLEKVEKND